MPRAVTNFERLKPRRRCLSRRRRSLYVYRLRMGGHAQTGVAGCFSLDEYDRDVIKKHEHTRRDKEDDRTRHLLDLRAQTGPVFLTYRARPAIDGLVERVTTGKPLYDFTAADGVQHTSGASNRREERQLVEAFDAVPALYIADGHHRAASAARARQQLRGRGGQTRRVGHVPRCGVSRCQVQILPYNRSCQDLAGMIARRISGRAAEAIHRARTVQHRPRGKGMWRCSWTVVAHASSWVEAQVGASSTDRLDVSRLQDARADAAARNRRSAHRQAHRFRRRRPRHGGAGAARATRASAAVAFSMYPVSVRRSDGDCRRRRHHAAEVHLVRAQAPRRVAVASDLSRGTADDRGQLRDDHCHADMPTRIFNFSAGPAVCRSRCSSRRSATWSALPGVGMSVMEISHRSKTFEDLLERAPSPTSARWRACPRTTGC